MSLQCDAVSFTPAFFSALSQEWPLVRQLSISYLAPSLRPPDLPPQKPPRPNLLRRIVRRLKSYWNPPVKGELV